AVLTVEAPGHAVEDAALSPDGEGVLAVLIDQAKRTRDLRLWDARTGKTKPLLAGHGFPALGERKAERNEVEEMERQVQELPHGGNPPPPEHAILFPPTGQTLATATPDNQARLWDARTGELLAGPLPAIPWLLAFSEDGQSLLTIEPIYARGVGEIS